MEGVRLNDPSPASEDNLGRNKTMGFTFDTDSNRPLSIRLLK